MTQQEKLKYVICPECCGSCCTMIAEQCPWGYDEVTYPCEFCDGEGDDEVTYPCEFCDGEGEFEESDYIIMKLQGAV